MFAKLSTLALVVPLIAGLTLNTPPGTVVSGGTFTLTWTAATTDAPYFSLELVNTVFNDEYAIGNNVQTSLGSYTVALPAVPGITGYTIQAIATNDVNTVYSTTGAFSISTTSGSTTLPASTVTGTTTAPSSTGTTPTSSATTPVSSVSSVSSAISAASSGSSSGTSTGSASSSPSSLSSGAASFKMDGIVPAAALVLSAIAGAAMVF